MLCYLLVLCLTLVDGGIFIELGLIVLISSLYSIWCYYYLIIWFYCLLATLVGLRLCVCCLLIVCSCYLLRLACCYVVC